MRKTSHGIGKECWMIGDKKLYEVVTTLLHAHLKDKPFRLREKVFSRKKVSKSHRLLDKRYKYLIDSEIIG